MKKVKFEPIMDQPYNYNSNANLLNQNYYSPDIPFKQNLRGSNLKKSIISNHSRLSEFSNKKIIDNNSLVKDYMKDPNASKHSNIISPNFFDINLPANKPKVVPKNNSFINNQNNIDILNISVSSTLQPYLKNVTVKKTKKKYNDQKENFKSVMRTPKKSILKNSHRDQSPQELKNDSIKLEKSLKKLNNELILKQNSLIGEFLNYK